MERGGEACITNTRGSCDDECVFGIGFLVFDAAPPEGIRAKGIEDEDGNLVL